MAGPDNDDDETPLISDREEDGHGGLRDALLRPDAAAHGEDARRDGRSRGRDDSVGSFVWLLTLSACISGLLFGCKWCPLFPSPTP